MDATIAVIEGIDVQQKENQIYKRAQRGLWASIQCKEKAHAAMQSYVFAASAIADNNEELAWRHASEALYSQLMSRQYAEEALVASRLHLNAKGQIIWSELYDGFAKTNPELAENCRRVLVAGEAEEKALLDMLEKVKTKWTDERLAVIYQFHVGMAKNMPENDPRKALSKQRIVEIAKLMTNAPDNVDEQVIGYALGELAELQGVGDWFKKAGSVIAGAAKKVGSGLKKGVKFAVVDSTKWLNCKVVHSTIGRQVGSTVVGAIVGFYSKDAKLGMKARSDIFTSSANLKRNTCGGCVTAKGIEYNDETNRVIMQNLQETYVAASSGAKKVEKLTGENVAKRTGQVKTSGMGVKGGLAVAILGISLAGVAGVAGYRWFSKRKGGINVVEKG